MIQIEFSSESIQALAYERYHHPHPHVQRKAQAVWFKSQGLSHQAIARLTGVSVNTVTTYLREYQEGGIEQLKVIRFRAPESELKGYQTSIEEDFRQTPPASVKEAMSRIESLTGIKRSETQIRVFLKALGLSRRKVGMVPAKANPERQEAFKKKS